MLRMLSQNSGEPQVKKSYTVESTEEALANLVFLLYNIPMAGRIQKYEKI